MVWGGPITGYLDDVSIESIPEPTTALLLIPGLGGVLAILRRMRKNGLSQMMLVKDDGPLAQPQPSARTIRPEVCIEDLFEQIERRIARLEVALQPVSFPAGVVASALSFLERVERASSQTCARISAAADRVTDRFWSLLIH